MESLTELRRATNATLCVECGKCTSVCPLATASDFSARALACQHVEEKLLGDGDNLRRCLTCGTCEVRCPQEVRFTELVRGVRRMSPIEEGDTACPHGGTLLSLMRLMARENLKQDRLGWIDGELRTEPEKGDVFYWTGCAVYYDTFFPEYDLSLLNGTKAAVRLMNALGVVPVVSPDEKCCGHDLLWSGDRKSFELLAEHNVKLVADSGAKTVVTSCAECLRTWMLDYESVFPGRMPRVLHISEFLAENLPRLKLRSNGADAHRRVTYQDPCRLGRHLGIYEPPRRVLEAMPHIEVTEMRRKERASICCSGSWSHCDRCVKRIQVDRLREARDTGAEVMVTACPKCQIHFRCAMKDRDRADEVRVETRDIAELVVEALATGD